MSTKRWPTIEETARLAREGIIDDSKLRSRPDAETMKAIEADLEQFEAKYRAEQEAARQKKRTRRPA
ncbi:MAG TPA: hypothetical protein VII06_39405 [Chloroflexota bacterium]